MFTTLISVEILKEHLEDPEWVVIDSRFNLLEPAWGRLEYEKGHIPGAQYAHLDEDLSSPVIPGKTGRHPLPKVDTLANKLSAWGIDQGTQVVVYDSNNGGYAVRLWWLLRWLGHQGAAVLDGGWGAWQKAGLPVETEVRRKPARRFIPKPQPEMVVSAAEVQQMISDPAWIILDARAAERYRGEVEPIDPVAGHIPGAFCLPYLDNVGADGKFLPKEFLRKRFEAALQGRSVDRSVAYCGSGVTSAHHILAMEHAGLGTPRLYTGSWSEWITDPGRPIERGQAKS